MADGLDSLLLSIEYRRAKPVSVFVSILLVCFVECRCFKDKLGFVEKGKAALSSRQTQVCTRSV